MYKTKKNLIFQFSDKPKKIHLQYTRTANYKWFLGNPPQWLVSFTQAGSTLPFLSVSKPFSHPLPWFLLGRWNKKLGKNTGLKTNMTSWKAHHYLFIGDTSSCTVFDFFTYMSFLKVTRFCVKKWCFHYQIVEALNQSLIQPGRLWSFKTWLQIIGMFPNTPRFFMWKTRRKNSN